VPDGIVIATTLWDESGVCLTKLTDQGVGDAAFGTDGATILNGVGPVCQMVVQPDGKVLLLTAGPLDGAQRLFRLDRDGALDSTFGDAGQITLSDAFSDWVEPTGDIVVAPDGKIVVVAQGDDPDGEDGDLNFYRFSTTGRADESFGDHGEARIRGSYYWWIGDSQIGSDGTISVCANSWDISTYIVQLDGRGKPLPGFGQGGVLILPRTEDVAFWGDGTLLITQHMSPGLTLRRTTFDGQPVTSFGENGTATLFGPEEAPLLNGVFGLSNGTIVLVIQWGIGSSQSIVVVHPDGSLDSTFGAGAGYVNFPDPAGTYEYPGTWDLDVDAQGRFIYLSPPVTEADDNTSFELTRLAADGSLDSTFGEGGVASVGAEKIVGPPMPPSSPPPPSLPAGETPESESDDGASDGEGIMDGVGDGSGDQSGDSPATAFVAPSVPSLWALLSERSAGLFNSDRPILGTESGDLFGG